MRLEATRTQPRPSISLVYGGIKPFCFHAVLIQTLKRYAYKKYARFVKKASEKWLAFNQMTQIQIIMQKFNGALAWRAEMRPIKH